MWTSVPQMPVRRTSISTSLMPYSGTGTSSIHSPTSAFFLTSARIVFFMGSPIARVYAIGGGNEFRTAVEWHRQGCGALWGRQECPPHQAEAGPRGRSASAAAQFRHHRADIGGGLADVVEDFQVVR